MSIATTAATAATAPTAELSAPPGPEADLDSLYEVVDGRRVEKPTMSVFECIVNTSLTQYLSSHARANRLGRVIAENLFRINPPGEPQRRPDLAFVSYERWPRDRKLTSANAWEVVPDLAIEVISPSNTMKDVFGKVHEYFRAGVRRVWIVLPAQRQVYVYASAKATAILGMGDVLDGGDLLPGFRLPLAELFEDGADA